MSTARRNEVITRVAWDHLPWLLSRAVVREITGLSSAELSAEVRAGRLHMHRRRGGYGKFFKSEIEALCRPR
jgi:hypothetical protein